MVFKLIIYIFLCFHIDYKVIINILLFFGPRLYCIMPMSSSFDLTAHFHHISMKYESWLGISNVFKCMMSQMDAGICRPIELRHNEPTRGKSTAIRLKIQQIFFVP